MDKKNIRIKRITQQVHSSINKILTESADLIDPVLVNNPVIITKVELSGDFRIAKCFVNNANKTGQEHVLVLNKNKKRIRFFLTKFLDMKFSPEVKFLGDQDYHNKNNQIDTLLDLISKSTSLEERLK